MSSPVNLNKVLKSLKESMDFTKEVEIIGVTYKLRLLSLSEEQKANSDAEMDDLEGIAYMNKMRVNILSYAIIQMNEHTFDSVVDYEEEDGTIVKKERSIVLRDVLQMMPANIIESLFDIYVDLKEEAELKIKGNLNYKWFKDPETREKEMREKIRKFQEQRNSTDEESISFTKIDDAEDKEEESQETNKENI